VYNCPVLAAKETEIPVADVDNAWTIVMKKRTFIRFFAAAAASPVISPLLAWASKDKLKNWAGNLEYSTDRLYSATSLEEVRSYVKKQSKLKVLGTRHCFNNVADSTDNFCPSSQ
jgi:alditol oxidase